MEKLSVPIGASDMELKDEKETYGLSPVLTVDEVASFLRMNRKSVYAAVAEGTLPARKVRRRVVILREALLDWLRSKSELPSRRRRS